MSKTQKSQEIDIKFTITDHSNFDKRCSGAHFVYFLFCYYCTSFEAWQSMPQQI